MLNDFDNITALYSELKANYQRYKPRFDSIAKFSGIEVQPDYQQNPQMDKSADLDEYMDDPTSALSINQSGDYLVGIMWGTGAGVLNLKPSRHVTDLISDELVKPWYKYATGQLLYHMNHPECGFIGALRPYAYEQQSYGTSGVGLFLNSDYLKRTADHALIARNYGVDNAYIAEGKSGVIEVVFAVHNWKINRILGEFCKTNGQIDNKKVAKMPKVIQDAYSAKDFNKPFMIIQGVFPRENYDPKMKGKRGTKYRGVWFLDNGNSDRKFFHEEDYKKRPINMGRQVRIRGEDYGRASGTMLMSTIRTVNFLVGESADIIEKMGKPALGMFSNAIMGDNVLDTSPDGLTVFNQMLMGGTNQPTFPLYDVGDPSAMIQFLLPYLTEKITTAFKVDLLLDFSSAKEMTAAESMQRFVIRGKSLATMLGQQKNELLVPSVDRAASLLLDIGELGVRADEQPSVAKSMLSDKRLLGRVIPDEVLQVIEAGLPWYEIVWNNELEKLTRTESVQALLQIINTVGAVAALYPEILMAVDWYKLVKEINDNLAPNSEVLITETEFREAVKAQAEARAQAMALQAAQAGAAVNKDNSQANKNNQEAFNGNR